MSGASTQGPVVFGYDGSELAAFAIENAGAQLATPRDAVVVCVWQPVDVGFTPVGEQHLDADRADQVRAAAERTAEHGAELARRAGFTATALAHEASPTWQGIVRAAEEQAASLIVLGAHCHGSLAGRLFGHVTSDVLNHVPTSSVLVVHKPD